MKLKRDKPTPRPSRFDFYKSQNEIKNSEIQPDFFSGNGGQDGLPGACGPAVSSGLLFGIRVNGVFGHALRTPDKSGGPQASKKCPKTVQFR
jgi:hypothetical protein